MGFEVSLAGKRKLLQEGEQGRVSQAKSRRRCCGYENAYSPCFVYLFVLFFFTLYFISFFLPRCFFTPIGI